MYRTVAFHVIDVIDLTSVNDFDLMLFSCFPDVRKRLTYAMVRHSDGGHPPLCRAGHDGFRIRQRIQCREPGMHVQFHSFLRGIVRTDIPFAFHDVSGFQDHILIVTAVSDISLHHQMVAFLDLVQDPLIVGVSQIAGDPDGSGKVGDIKDQHRRAAFLKLPGLHGYDVTFHDDRSGVHSQVGHRQDRSPDVSSHQHGSLRASLLGLRTFWLNVDLRFGIIRDQIHFSQVIHRTDGLADEIDLRRCRSFIEMSLNRHGLFVDIHVNPGDVCLRQSSAHGGVVQAFRKHC